MKARINRTVEVELITIHSIGWYIRLNRDLKVVVSNEKAYCFEVHFTTDEKVHSVSGLFRPQWLTDLINSRPEVGSTLDAKYHGLFSQFLNENIQL